jgi:hypothetical protein
MSSYPIYHKIISDDSPKLKWGSRKSTKERIMIGSSKKNSTPFAELETRLVSCPTFEHNYWKFELILDGTTIKEGIFTDNNGCPGELVDFSCTVLKENK